MSQQRPRGPRTSISAPSTGTLGAAVAVAALVLGFLILRDVRSDGGATVTPGTDSTENPTDSSVDPNAPTTVPFNISGFKIQVANASGVALSAGKMTTDLQAQGYVVQPALNVPAGTAKRQKTGVFYLAGCETNAQYVATTLGGAVDMAAMPSPVPVEGAASRRRASSFSWGPTWRASRSPGWWAVAPARPRPPQSHPADPPGQQ